MVHPEVDGWHEILMLMGVVPKQSLSHMKEATIRKQAYDVSIGRFKSDKRYHVLGYRPHEGGSAYFSSNECASLDLGLVELPDGKSSIAELVRGDVVTVKTEPKDWHITYVGK